MGLNIKGDHPENSPQGQKAKEDAVKADRSTGDVQQQVDQDEARGLRGVEVDPTPNDAYSVKGVTSGAPTPETDDQAYEAAQKAQADIARQANGVAGR